MRSNHLVLVTAGRFSILASLAIACHGAATAAQLDFSRLHSFGTTNPVGVHVGELVRGGDGRFYGATSAGVGGMPGGTIFRLDTNGANPEVVVPFSNIADSSTSQQRMVYGSDGGLYVCYHTVGSSVDGGLAKVQLDGSGFQIKLTFAAVQTRTWKQLLEGSDGRLYAIAASLLVSVNRDGTGFTVFHTNQTANFGPSEPDLILEGFDGALFVTETGGGDSGRGVIYRVNKDGSGRTNLLDFGSLSFDMGSYPHQLIQGSDKSLYGVALSLNQDGSFPSLGSPVFRMNPDGSNFQVIGRLENFPVSGPSGLLREGGYASALFEGQDGRLYGATQNGGANRAGLVFRLGKDGSGFTNILAFPPAYFLFDSGAGVNRTPGKSLVEGFDRRIHGSMSADAVFRFLADGTGFETTYGFPDPSKEGANVRGALATDGEGVLFGTTANGGNSDGGTVYRLRTDGSRFTYLRRFVSAQDGSQPLAGVLVASDGRLYGTCSAGGTGTAGTVFRMDANGNNYQVLHTFLSSGGDGRVPSSPLLEAADGLLYGTTYFGGGAAAGCIFKVGTDGSGYSILHRFTNSVSGANPSARLLQGLDGRLYGVAETNGPGGQGVVFSIRTNGIGFSLLHTFTSASPGLRKPQGELIQSPDGTLFGTTSAGGTSGLGGVYSVKPDGTLYQVLREFSSTGGDGRVAVAGLAFGLDGRLYGVTQFGGGSVNGSIFRLATDGAGYEKLLAFSGLNGEGGNPVAALVRGQDGAFYGTTSAGGDFGSGTVYRVSLPVLSPWLSLSRVGGNLLQFEWTQTFSGFHLETLGNASGVAGWQTLTDSPILTNGNFRITLPLNSSAGFYRLANP
jgi:uncharacterized repeat protein (TIGR03803 family)